MDYKQAGVDKDLADKFVGKIQKMVAAQDMSRVVGGIGGFASVWDLDGERFLAASTDGVGTKLKLAFDLGIHDTVGIDLVAMCANDLICTGAKPLFFLDYFATGKLQMGTAEAVLLGIVKGCHEAGMVLVGGETAEMPGLYREGEYDLAGFSVGDLKREDLLTGTALKEGDRLIGLASSGFHSNGFSLVRKILDEKVPASQKKELQKLCLTPTILYVKTVQTLQNKFPKMIKGMANITGSGVLNIPRMNENLSYHLESWPSEVAEPIQKLKPYMEVPEKELLTTFNMGVGFVISVAAENAKAVQSELTHLGHKNWDLGFVSEKGEAEAIWYQGQKLE